jgi:hypothetical protein
MYDHLTLDYHGSRTLVVDCTASFQRNSKGTPRVR